MLHILFLILKIIGIILLVIIGITLALVGVVLFVPIRYRLKTETSNGVESLRTEARATWLLHLISAYITYEDKEMDWQVRVGWKKFKANEEDVEEDENLENKETVRNIENYDKEQDSGDEQTSNREKTYTSQQSTKKENRIEKIKCTIQRICGKIKNIKDFLMEETHIQAFLRLKKELIFFIKKIKPDKIKGYIRFGLEDPYNTGRVLAMLSVLYPFYGENFQIHPEFEREIIEGDVFFKGRIHLMHLLLVLSRLYFDKNVKTAYKKLKELKR